MGWEQRNGRWYYYRKKRIDGRVQSVYVGPGSIGDLALAFDQLDHRQREMQRFQQDQAAEWLKDVDAKLYVVGELARKAAARLLREQYGLHQHKGTWRRRRAMAKKKTDSDDGASSMPEAQSGDQAEKTLATSDQTKNSSGRALLEEILDTGDLTAQERRELAKYPRDKGHTVAGGAIEHALARLKISEEEREFYRSDLKMLRLELGYAEAPTAEQLMIDQVLLCYLRMALVETRYAEREAESKDPNLGWERKLSAVQNRFIRSVESLSRVRKLLGRPPLQINLATAGGQQVVNNQFSHTDE